MEMEQIREILKYFDKSAASRMKLHHGTFMIELEKSSAINETPKQLVAQAPQQVIALQAPVTIEPVEVKASGEIITSPMVGTFYKAPSPDSPAFAKAGDKLKKGAPLAIIEAMKIMNEIDAEFDFKVLEVLVDDGQPVEYDMPLFRVERI
jgi:acetyl-CoA carboxylase biotin carboxyl carrier protein